MLDNYYLQRRDFIQNCTEVESERPFAVRSLKSMGGLSISLEDWIKSLGHREQGRLVIEHKTTGWYAKDTGFRTDYLESFSPNSQVDGYLFAGHSLYDGGVKAVWVDAALTHKTVHDKFRFIPIDRQFAALDAWLVDVKNWVTRMIGELDANEIYNPSVEVPMPVFPKNTSSCHLYSGCTYRSVCRDVPNPSTLKSPPPVFA